jgi:hypothetical protein
MIYQGNRQHSSTVTMDSDCRSNERLHLSVWHPERDVSEMRFLLLRKRLQHMGPYPLNTFKKVVSDLRNKESIKTIIKKLSHQGPHVSKPKKFLSLTMMSERNER